MKNFSVGVDIEEVNRVKKLVRNRRFLRRVFSDKEITYCRSKKNQAQHFAVRFAAKEAVWKAMSDIFGGSGNHVSHTEVSVHNTSSGKPVITLPKRFARYKNKITISLSHSRSYVVAVALVKGS